MSKFGVCVRVLCILSGLRRKERHSKARDPYGVARLDLSGLLSGQKMFEVTVPILNGPVECKEEGRLSVGGVFDPASKGIMDDLGLV